MNLTREVVKTEIKTDIAIDFTREEFDIEDALKRLEQVRAENPGYLKITMEIQADYDREISLHFYGHHLESEEVFNKRVTEHNLISKAWAEHDAKKKPNELNND